MKTRTGFYSPARQRWWYTLVNFHWARVRFGPVPLASCGNGSIVNSPAAVYFTVFSQTPCRPSYFQSSTIAKKGLLWIPDCFKSENIGINYGFECINIRRVPRKMFEHEAEGWVFKHLPRDTANVNTLKTLVDRYSCINLMQFFFYRGFSTFKMQEKCDTNLQHSVSLRSTDNFWKNRCSWMFCLCCFRGTVRARNVRKARHESDEKNS